MNCTNCAKYPFCSNCNEPTQEKCDSFIKIKPKSITNNTNTIFIDTDETFEI